MILLAIGLLARMGLSQRAAEKVAPWAVAAVLACALVAGWAVFDHFNDKAAIEQDRLQGNVEQLEGQVTADTHAADQRLDDAAAQSQQEQAYAQAIENPRAGDSDDPGIRLACEQLRRDGQDTAAIPGCGGR